jgi:hypothetical protein
MANRRRRRAQMAAAKVEHPMTNLPIPPMTKTERAALEFARQELVRYRNADTPWSSNSLLSPTASHTMVQSLLLFGLDDVTSRLRLVMLARLGWRDAIAALDRVILEYQSAHIALPSELAAWDMETKTFGMPAQWAGPKKTPRILRDLAIMLTTMAVVDRFELSRTKRSSTRRSACEIVATALESVGIFMGHKSVEKIVDRYRGAWPTVPGWSTPRNPVGKNTSYEN